MTVLRYLFLRPHNYNDVRWGVLREIDRLWAALPLPQGVLVKRIKLPKVAQSYPSCGALIPFLYRWYVAAREICEAEWVFVLDGDVFPTRRDAMFLLVNHLNSLPPSVQVVTSSNMSWCYFPSAYYTYGVSCAGVSAGICDGIKGVRKEVLHTYATQYTQLATSTRDNLIHPEIADSFIFSPVTTVHVLPPRLLLPLPSTLPFYGEQIPAAFVQCLANQSASGAQTALLIATKNILG